MLAIKVMIAKNKTVYAGLSEQERTRFELGLSKKAFAFTVFYKEESSSPETAVEDKAANLD